ncbi:hypothetical protein Tsubulata_022411 [Turnera subulata]|uniref:Uncharacterized protein n=1 Tax=Turnera subulata TaxID=218843 RepID=A0A9Q0JEC0_9ROSI|nr:hypothetical protein Tsubulata_022411 [Turnera subulata]
MEQRLYPGGGGGYQDHPHQNLHPQRPTSTSLSSTVESFSGPRPPATSSAAAKSGVLKKNYPRTPPVVPEDCHSDCDSSSSVVDDGDIATSSSVLCRRKALPFDLNFPPLDQIDFAAGDDDLHCTALCL